MAEHKESVDHMCQQVGSLVDEEVAQGIPKDRIIIGWYITLTIPGTFRYSEGSLFRIYHKACYSESLN